MVKLPNDILTKNYVINNGVDYGRLEYEYCGDRMILDPEPNCNEEEKIFSGLTYSIDDNGNLEFYGFYKKGFKEGPFVDFYQNGQISEYKEFSRGQITLEFEFYEDGSLKREAEGKNGVYLWYKNYDKKGNIIGEKKAPTEKDLLEIKFIEEWKKKIENRK